MPDSTLAETDDLSPEQLAAQWFARLDWRRQRLSSPRPPSRTISIWEDWIVNDPERSWALFVELVRRRPDDVDVMEQVWSRLGMLLERYGEAFLPRVKALVEGNALLRHIAPAGALDLAFYAPRAVDEDTLVKDYFAVLEHGEAARELDSLVRLAPQAALPLVLQIIERGPGEGLGSRETSGPLTNLLRQHGSAVIEAVEEAAARSVLVRRCLWRAAQRQKHPAEDDDIALDVLERVERAAGGTTDYNSDAASGEFRRLSDEQEQIVASWFTYRRSSWAGDHVKDLVWHDAEAAWPLVLRLIREAPDDRLEYVAAGDLEDLVRVHGPTMIDRIEAQAAADPRFRWALGCIWLSRGALPPDVEARVVAASGGEILVLNVDENEGIEPAG